MDNKAWAQGVAKKIKEKEIEVIKRSVNKVPYIRQRMVYLMIFLRQDSDGGPMVSGAV